MEASESKSPSKRGIAGWLVIPAIIAVVTPIAMAYGGIEAFVTAGRAHSRYRSVFYLDGMLASILAAAWVFCCYLMFQQHKHFPKMFMILLAAGVGKILVATFLYASLGVNIASLGTPFAAVFLPAAIWIPYMMFSKRVVATFTRG